MMNWRAIFAIARKDLRVVTKSATVMAPLIAVPLILLVLLPLVFGVLISILDLSDPAMGDFQELLVLVPDGLLADFEPITTDQQRIFLYVMGYLFVPFFLILPLMSATVIAADSFAGEKERKTLEALVYTPTSDAELFTAKVIAPLFASLLVTLIGFILYALVVNLTGAPLMGRIFFPNGLWLLVVFWVTPAASLLGIGVMVIVSSRVTSFQSAYQASGLVVIPVLLLMVGQLGGVLLLSPALVILIGALLWAIALILLWFGMSIFRREELLARL